jgi:hypothetical protein
MSKTVPDYLRLLFRAVAVYAAGAWVAVEVVDFAVRHYGLSNFLVDAAVIVAFGGGMVTAVLVWFHGESGRQKVSVSEIIVVSSILLTTVSGLLYLSSGSPTKAFDDLLGYRLVLEYRGRDNVDGNDDGHGHHIAMSPIEGIKAIDGGMFSLAPEDGHIRGPIIQSQFDGHPTMFVDSPDSDFIQVIFVLPFEPTDLRELIVLGTTHDRAKIDTAGLSIQIESSIAITEQENGATIRVNGRSGQLANEQ